MKKEKKLTFEEAFNELSKIVNELESGNLTLEDSMNLFEKGTKLLIFCRNKLKEAEDKINKLIKELEVGENNSNIDKL